VLGWLGDAQAWALVGAIAAALLTVGALVRKAFRAIRATFRAIRATFRTISRLGDELLGDREKGIPSVRAALEAHTADGHGGITRTSRPAGPWAPRAYPPSSR
jgi:hypothetical protein